jgi:cytochrome c oxidase assembly protein subunit 11
VSRSRSFGVAKMAGVALGAFGFAFALVPLYRIACEKVFGVRLEQGPAQVGAAAAATQERWVTVQFDGAVNSKLPWQFTPGQDSMRVQVGRQYETTYAARNTADRAIVGSAVPSVAPARASGYFSKTCRRARRATCRCASSSTRRCRPASRPSPCRTPSTRTTP